MIYSISHMFEMLSAIKNCNSENEYSVSLQNKMYEEIKLNLMPEKPEIKSETNIDWNFVLGLFFGIGYLIFGV